MRTIVVDILGGDNNSEEILKGLKEVYPSIKDTYRFAVAGPKEDVLRYFTQDEIILLESDTEVTNQTNPMDMLHDAEDTALVHSYKYLSNEDAKGLITVASTGCVLVGSLFKLGMLKGIKAPVLATELYRTDFTRFLLADCGANVDAQPQQLLSFAKMGNAYQKALGIENPRIGLANIGAEPGKGNKQMKEAFKLLSEADLNFVGNVEFTESFRGDVDVLVADGAIGNCILKNSEGVAKTILKLPGLTEEAKKNITHMFDYNNQGAAMLLGPKKIILKAHGAATKDTIISTVSQFIRLDQASLVLGIEREFQE